MQAASMEMKVCRYSERFGHRKPVTLEAYTGKCPKQLQGLLCRFLLLSCVILASQADSQSLDGGKSVQQLDAEKVSSFCGDLGLHRQFSNASADVILGRILFLLKAATIFVSPKCKLNSNHCRQTSYKEYPSTFQPSQNTSSR